jgi:hypothetical protein
MSKKIKIILGALIVIVIGVISVLLYINKPHPSYEKLDAEFTVTPKAIYDEFKSNVKTSGLKYNGKMIEINGMISKVEASDTLVTVVFAFTQGLFGDEGVRCAMLSKFNKSTKEYKQGDNIDLKGMCQGFNDTDVIFEKCSLIKKQ